MSSRRCGGDGPSSALQHRRGHANPFREATSISSGMVEPIVTSATIEILRLTTQRIGVLSEAFRIYWGF
jgi:hypothetical protein